MSFDNPRMLFKVSQEDPNLDYEKNLYRTLTVEDSETENYVVNEGWFTHPYLALEAYNNSLNVVAEPVDPEVTTATTKSRK